MLKGEAFRTIDQQKYVFFSLYISFSAEKGSYFSFLILFRPKKRLILQSLLFFWPKMENSFSVSF